MRIIVGFGILLSIISGMSRAFVLASRKSNKWIGSSNTSRFLSMKGKLNKNNFNIACFNWRNFVGGFANDESKPFYALGVNVARQVGSELKGILSKEEMLSMISGFSDSLMDKTSDEQDLLTQYGPKLNEILSERSNSLVDAEKSKGSEFQKDFLSKHKDAKQYPSGLIIRDTEVGTGEKPTLDSEVTVHYHGTLINGYVFDSSVERKQPLDLPLRNVIQGWQEGICEMRVGGKATLVVPSDIAYGDRGSPPVIPPGATLVFDVELIAIKK